MKNKVLGMLGLGVIVSSLGYTAFADNKEVGYDFSNAPVNVISQNNNSTENPQYMDNMDYEDDYYLQKDNNVEDRDNEDNYNSRDDYYYNMHRQCGEYMRGNYSQESSYTTEVR